MPQDRLTVALLSEVFPDADAWQRLPDRLKAARERGADLVVLPELPLNPWSPATREARAEDAERPEGPRHQALSAAAAEAGVAVLGGAIVEDDGVRRNRALLFSSDGNLLIDYDKCHLPHEEGFWEGAHYEPGEIAPRPVWLDGFALGIQVCSDLNRPELGHALAAAGALAIVGPRATEASTFDRWRLVLQSTAMTACCYVLSVTRPRPEGGVPLGGPSFVAGPDGAVLLETTDPLALVTLERAAVHRTRAGYPGYLRLRPDLYAKAWEAAGRAMAIEAAAAEDDTDIEGIEDPDETKVAGPPGGASTRPLPILD
jgi:predicted amidohydrolase